MTAPVGLDGEEEREHPAWGPIAGAHGVDVRLEAVGRRARDVDRSGARASAMWAA